MESLSLATRFGNSLLIMVIGLVVVFFGLTMLVLVCKVTGVAFVGKKGKEVKKEAFPANSLDTAATGLSEQAADNSDEIAAVIAAVTAIMTSASYTAARESEKIEGFYVRRIRRAGSASDWGKAGREELLSSRNFQ